MRHAEICYIWKLQSDICEKSITFSKSVLNKQTVSIRYVCKATISLDSNTWKYGVRRQVKFNNIDKRNTIKLNSEEVYCHLEIKEHITAVNILNTEGV